MTPYFLILALVLGLAPAFIAHSKGRSFLVWWAYGSLLGPVALIHSIMMRGDLEQVYAEPSDALGTPWHSPWPLLLRIAASFAIAIIAVAAYRFFVPPDVEAPGERQEVAVSSDRAPSERLPADRDSRPPDDPIAAAPMKEPARKELPQPPSDPAVNVTVRENAAPRENDAPKQGADSGDKGDKMARSADRPGARPDPAEPAPPDRVAVPAPPVPPPAPANERLERTEPLERTIAKKPAAPAEKPDAPAAKAEPTPKAEDPPAKEGPPVKDVETLAARTAPTEPTEAAPVAPEKPVAPRKKSLQKDAPEEKPVRRKSATRKAAAPKPAPPPPARSSTQSASQTPAQSSGQSSGQSDVTAVGETVRVVQKALAERGYDPGPASGRAGRQTEQAIRKFQLDRGLKPTGSIDYAVLEALNIVGPRVHAFRPPPGATPGR